MDFCNFFSLNCIKRMRSNILERRKRLARRSISLVDAMYEFSVTKKADEI